MLFLHHTNTRFRFYNEREKNTMKKHNRQQAHFKHISQI
ncbi:MAG: hypothetical protein OJF59_000467 [Cytophagales bacterium]|nr:MAG: hypothetical protein OJF59_000467 [Cytophagales bacterium]